MRNLIVLLVFLVGTFCGIRGDLEQDVKDLAALVRDQGFFISELRQENKDLAAVVRDQGSVVAQLRQENTDLSTLIRDQVLVIAELRNENKIQTTKIDELTKSMKLLENKNRAVDADSHHDLAQNVTIEERVSLLEIQIVEIEEDVTGHDEFINILFDEQVIQDERILSVEDRVLTLEGNNDQIEEELNNLRTTTLALDFRVTVLEENGGGGGGNSTVSELEERVETLEGTAADHESDIAELQSMTGDHETRLTSAEENVEGLLTADIVFEERITALEENGGGGSGGQNGTIAFHATLTAYDVIPENTPVMFNEVLLNEADGYDSTTGVFTVPSGGDGFYYFSTKLIVFGGEYGYLKITVNGADNCQTYGDGDNGEFDYNDISCSVVANLVQGDEVAVIYNFGTDLTPVYESTSSMFNVFNGFRI